MNHNNGLRRMRRGVEKEATWVGRLGCGYFCISCPAAAGWLLSISIFWGLCRQTPHRYLDGYHWCSGWFWSSATEPSPFNLLLSLMGAQRLTNSKVFGIGKVKRNKDLINVIDYTCCVWCEERAYCFARQYIFSALPHSVYREGEHILQHSALCSITFTWQWSDHQLGFNTSILKLMRHVHKHQKCTLWFEFSVFLEVGMLFGDFGEKNEPVKLFDMSGAAYLWLILLWVNKSLTLSEADQIAVRVLTGIHISLAAGTRTSSSTNAICELWHPAQSRTDEPRGGPDCVCVCVCVCVCEMRGESANTS